MKVEVDRGMFPIVLMKQNQNLSSIVNLNL